MKTLLATMVSALMLVSVAFAVPMEAPVTQAATRPSPSSVPSSDAERLYRMEQRFHAH